MRTAYPSSRFDKLSTRPSQVPEKELNTPSPPSPSNEGEDFLGAPEVSIVGFSGEDAGAMAAAHDRHFWLRHRTGLVLWAVRRFAGTPRRGLNIGCSGGAMMQALARHWPGLVMEGADISPDALAVAACLNSDARLHHGDAACLAFDGAYDLLGLFDVLEHISDDNAALAGAARALAPGGHIFVTVPQHRFLWSHLDELVGHQRRYRASDLAGQLLCCGLEIRAILSYGALLLPLAAVARFAYRDAANVADILRLGGLANGAFHIVEHALIRAGVRFPFGDSILAVARKP